MRPALQHSTERGVLDNSVLQYLSCSQSNILNLLDGSMIFHFFEAAAKDHATVITAAVIGTLNLASWQLSGCQIVHRHCLLVVPSSA